MNTQVPLSVVETAFAADVSAKVVQHALARGVVRRVSKKREAPLPSAAAFALAVLKHSPVDVAQRDQRALFEAFAGRSRTDWQLQLERGTVVLPRGPMETSFRAPELLDTVAKRVALLEQMHARMERRDDILSGTLIFKGTRASVQRVGALMLRPDVPRHEVIEDYPRLHPTDFELAELYVRLHPRPRGRPIKRIKIRRV
jgi:uncharacterized protein (DUF433 family)